MNIQLLLEYFPQLSETQIAQFKRAADLYLEWNDKINVISRKDTASLLERHFLHSLGIARVMPFAPETRVLDIGTGGGFPGIPLAILFPEAQFTLVDSIGKKIKVVESIAEEIGLKNVTAIHGRAEKVSGTFHFIVSRAVTAMPQFLPWTRGKFAKEQFNAKHNGILYLKGGDLAEELAGIKSEIIPLSRFFEGEFFETKKVVYISKGNI